MRTALAALALLAAACTQTVRAQAAPPLTSQQQQRMTPIARVVRDVGAAVVNVYQDAVQDVDLPWPYNHFSAPQRTTSLGSGFIIDPDGYVLTNAHVIPLGSGGIRVRLADDSEYAAELVNADPENDVALLKITPAPGVTLPSVRLGTSSDVMVGETIVAIGNPLGNENTVSEGIVSSLFREVKVPRERGEAGPRPVFRDYIQIDAPINPGNSGGPLLNVLGDVIGINFAIESQAEGIGFAIPIDRVRHTLSENLLNPRLKREIVTGLQVQADQVGCGLKVAQVEPDGPAAHAGLKDGDRLLSLGGKPLNWEFDFNKALLGSRPGDRVELVVERDGHKLDTALQLGRDDSPPQAIWRRMGVSVVDHPRYRGVRIERIDPTGPAASLHLQTGDLIDGLDDRQVDSVLDLEQLTRERPPGESVTIHIWRGKGSAYGTLHLQ
jgi:S1-C subfamily serine protease